MTNAEANAELLGLPFKAKYLETTADQRSLALSIERRAADVGVYGRPGVTVMNRTVAKAALIELRGLIERMEPLL